MIKLYRIYFHVKLPQFMIDSLCLSEHIGTYTFYVLITGCSPVFKTAN